MSEIESQEHGNKHPLLSLLLIVVVVSLAFTVVGPLVGFLFAMPFYPGSITEMIESMQNPGENPSLKIPLYIIQGFATFVGLILAPIWFLQIERKRLGQLFAIKPDLVIMIITVFIVIVFMGVNSIVIEWNANLNFPELASEFETWAREKEDLAAEMTRYLTKFDSLFEVALALFVIAVLPAFGEEIVFRGIIQNILRKLTGNIHVSIWIAALLFSAIHLQFFGFFPRVLLGALFGYLYYWSGSLSVAVLAHFVNNGFSILAMYFYQKGTVGYDLEKEETLPLSVVAFCVVASVGLLFYFYNYYKNKKTDINPL